MKFDLLLYAITDRSWEGESTLEEQLTEALEAGVTLVQLREKELEDGQFLAKAKAIKEITDRYRVPLIINDNVEVAIAYNAAGVHIGQSDSNPEEVRRRIGPDKILGVTAKTVEQAITAQRQGADYLGSGAVFGSLTKKDARTMTMEMLQQITGAVSIPVVAIGGINRDNIERLEGSGVAGAAIVSGIFGAANIGQAVRELRQRAEMITGRMEQIK